MQKNCKKMGVRGLQRWIEEQGQEAWQELGAGATLLVDGSGLAIFLLDEAGPIGGDYEAYDTAVSKFIGQVRDAKLRMVVYRDGKKRRMKASTQWSRVRQRREEWEELRMYCNDGNSAKRAPFPPLFSWQFYGTLSCLGVQVVECEEEADQQLALDCSKGGPSCYILGLDSDFYCFKGCTKRSKDSKLAIDCCCSGLSLISFCRLDHRKL